MVCPECNLIDPYNGQGDGIGSCDCPRCPVCSNADPGGLCEAEHAERAAEYEGMDDYPGWE